MPELRIDLTDRGPQLLTRELAEQADVLVTVGCGDQCPSFQAGGTSTGTSATPPASQSSRFAISVTKSSCASRACSTASTLGSDPGTAPSYARRASALAEELCADADAHVGSGDTVRIADVARALCRDTSSPGDSRSGYRVHGKARAVVQGAAAAEPRLRRQESLRRPLWPEWTHPP